MNAAAGLRLADLESRRICRFCLRTCPPIEEGGGLTNIGADSTVVSRIEFALTLEVAAADGLPQRICDGCEWLLEKFHLFKDQCVRAEMLLKTFTESGVPLMQYFEPVKFEEFRWKKKEWAGVDVGVQAVEEIKQEPVYPMMAPEAIKQEAKEEVEEEWSYAEEPAMELNVDHADRATMDEIARQIYESEDALSSLSRPENMCNVADLVTDMEIGSPHVSAPNIEAFEDISNDTVEFNAPTAATEEPSKPPEVKVEPCSNFPEDVLLLMGDAEQSQDPKQTATDSPLSPSVVIYEGLQTTPLRESDGLPSRFADMEPGEIMSDDEFENSSAVISVSSDTEDNASLPPATPKPVEILPLELRPPPAPAPTVVDEFRCGKCDRAFPQAQLLEAHQKAYHSTTVRRKLPPSSHQKMAIMIDNPTKRCPKCAAMVHKASYWTHIRSHSAGERALVNYDKDKNSGASSSTALATAQSSVLEDDCLWDKS